MPVTISSEKLAHMRAWNAADPGDLCTCGHRAIDHYMNVNCDCTIYDGCKCRGYTPGRYANGEQAVSKAATT